MKKSLTCLILYALLIGQSCQPSSGNEANDFPIGTFPYNLNEPTQKYFLHDDLVEISGLSYFRPNQLACIQDEEGKLFIYDTSLKKIVHRKRFGKPGDYEGVEVVNGELFVVRSDGTLFHFPFTEDRHVEAEQIDTPLSEKNDVEGLGYDPLEQLLLLVCKEEGGLSDNRTDGKAIYAYRLREQQLNSVPFLVINPDSLKAHLPTQKNSKKANFKPSGIAIHPNTGLLYVLASDGKAILVLDRKGSIVNGVRLNPKAFKQPEGICFAPNGDLFIASEGQEGSGYLMQFEPLSP